jgi:hypothetical protein
MPTTTTVSPLERPDPPLWPVDGSAADGADVGRPGAGVGTAPGAEENGAGVGWGTGVTVGPPGTTVGLMVGMAAGPGVAGGCVGAAVTVCGLSVSVQLPAGLLHVPATERPVESAVTWPAHVMAEWGSAPRKSPPELLSVPLFAPSRPGCTTRPPPHCQSCTCEGKVADAAHVPAPTDQRPAIAYGLGPEGGASLPTTVWLNEARQSSTA